MNRHGHRTIGTTMLTGIVAVKLTVLVAVCAWAGPVPPVHNERGLPANALAKRVVIYNRPYTGAIYSDYVPNRDEVQTEFATSMAGNEYEPIQVGLYLPGDKKALENITLQVKCDIPSQIGRIHYSPANEHGWMDLESKPAPKRSWYWPVEKRKWYWPVDRNLLVGRRVHMPTFVIPEPRIESIEPGRSAAFWVTFKTDEKSSAGLYRGTFIIRTKGTTLERIPFTVKVYPFMLPRPKIHYGMYYRNEMHVDVPYQSPSFTRMYFADMAAHGMNFMQSEGGIWGGIFVQEGYDRNSSTPVGDWERRTLENYFGPEDYEPDGGYNALKLADIKIGTGQEVGLIQRDHPCTIYCGWSSGAKAADRLMRVLREQRDWPYFMMMTRDEPPRHMYRQINRHIADWRRLGAVTITAMSSTAAFGVGAVHSVWIVPPCEITPELQREAERLGSDVWTYNFNLRGTNAEAGRFYSGLYTWSMGLKGNIVFPYYWKGSVFDADWKLSSPYTLGYIAPSPRGPVPGVGFEGRREGIDDVRYLQLLEARAAVASQDDPTAREARCWLMSLRDGSQTTEFTPGYYVSWGTDYMDPHSGISPTDYDGIRAKAADLIMRLVPANGEQNPEPSEWVQLRAKPLEADAYAKASTAECLEVLRTGSVKQKRQAAGALAMREANEILPARELLAGLLDDPEVRMVAVRALAKLGPEAAPAIPSIGKLLASKDIFVQGAADYALTQINHPATYLLTQCAQDPNLNMVMRDLITGIATEAEAKLKKK